jgi:hypothetical protein
MQLSGKLHAIFETKQITERFQKRDFVIETADNPIYPQLVILQLTGERCTVLDGFALNQMVNVEFNVRGREWKSPSGEIKYFNSLDAWTIESDEKNQHAAEESTAPETPWPPDDDIPF